MRLFDIWIDFVNLRSEEYTENSRIPSKVITQTSGFLVLLISVLAFFFFFFFWVHFYHVRCFVSWNHMNVLSCLVIYEGKLPLCFALFLGI